MSLHDVYTPGFPACYVSHAVANGLRRRFAIGGADAEHALDAPDDAADRGADDGTDRACDPVAFVSTTDEAAGNALRVRRDRHSEGCNNGTCEQHFRIHSTLLYSRYDVFRRQPRLAFR